ncbi:MAG: NUDIX hydrolase, partial [Candidatus Aenigmarchaeota archaeon]|nr:NUDIX hydrolase [Candidatus Aenigmarchaeota archaeon]
MYKNPKATVDVVVEKDNKILLIIRCVEPHKGRLGLPGGHVNFGEKVEDAAKRETEEETGLKVEIKTILGVFSDPKREP